MNDMISFAHIIHPGEVDEASDLRTAQPITFETMRVARDFAEGSTRVSLYAVQHHDEARIPLPREFTRTPDLTRSIMDLKAFNAKRKLALIKDILDALVEADRQADVLIYTNVDIALQPYFYRSLARIVEQGFDAFVVNRRTIPGRQAGIEQLPLLYADIGAPHPGYDCFVFRRELYPRFRLGTMCIGTAWVGRAMLANMVLSASRFKEFRDQHLTFHMGDSVRWRQNEYQDYMEANLAEYLRILGQWEREKGRLPPVWRSYLLDTGSERQYPSFG